MSPCQEAKRGCAKDLGGGNWRGTGLATSIRGFAGLCRPPSARARSSRDPLHGLHPSLRHDRFGVNGRYERPTRFSV